MSGNNHSEVVHLIKREQVEMFIDIFKQIDENIYTLLKQANLPDNLHKLDAKYTYLPEATLKNLVQILASKTNKQDFGILVWSACKNIYIPKYIANLTETRSLKSVLDEFGIKLKKISSNAHVYTEFSGGKWWLIREKSGTEELWFKYAEMFSVVFMCELLRALTGNKWKPEEIGIRTESHEDFLALPELNGAQFYTNKPVTAVYIPSKLMEASVILPKQIDVIEQPDDSHIYDFLQSFKLAIKPYIAMGKLPIKMAAKILNMNVRTIQRKLEKEGVRYDEVVESMVLEKMLELLKRDSVHISVISAQLGYSNPSHFSRAFKRLMHMTPNQYRKQQNN
ncbi:helix-turn-helix transcriptional regulator [Vibrio sp. DW001]|uniref:helix-turn-helix domain-containing protein n=1 Tax=Vibrio sp. DW001 TaxID=2912315 RepID=UPI0023AF7BB5|nr:helix-turn-helix transcriptional regulator [Vibrio sp. DW001]WED28088.1 helix-turn-helix transcriptional regulator [Vibrio sp. DW001]